MSENKKSKPGVFSSIAKWMRELKSELKKVQWPSAKMTTKNTIIVIVCVIVVGVVIWISDALALKVVDGLRNLAALLLK